MDAATAEARRDMFRALYRLARHIRAERRAEGEKNMTISRVVVQCCKCRKWKNADKTWGQTCPDTDARDRGWISHGYCPQCLEHERTKNRMDNFLHIATGALIAVYGAIVMGALI